MIDRIKQSFLDYLYSDRTNELAGTAFFLARTCFLAGGVISERKVLSEIDYVSAGLTYVLSGLNFYGYWMKNRRDIRG